MERYEPTITSIGNGFRFQLGPTDHEYIDVTVDNDGRWGNVLRVRGGSQKGIAINPQSGNHAIIRLEEHI